MLFKWLNAGEATEVGTALADDFVLHSDSAGIRKVDKPHAPGHELQKFLQKFLQRVDRDARPLKLNLFKRAKLANSFKWRLLEKGVEPRLVDELTQALVLRLTVNQGGRTHGDESVAASSRRSVLRNSHALLTQGGEALARGAHAEAIGAYQGLLGF